MLREQKTAARRWRGHLFRPPIVCTDCSTAVERAARNLSLRGTALIRRGSPLAHAERAPHSTAAAAVKSPAAAGTPGTEPCKRRGGIRETRFMAPRPCDRPVADWRSTVVHTISVRSGPVADAIISAATQHILLRRRRRRRCRRDRPCRTCRPTTCTYDPLNAAKEDLAVDGLRELPPPDTRGRGYATLAVCESVCLPVAELYREPADPEAKICCLKIFCQRQTVVYFVNF